MNKAELVDAVAKVSEVSKASVEKVLDCLGKVAQSNIYSGEETVLPGIGKIKLAQRKARTGRNPSTGEEINIPAKGVPSFSAAKALKDAANPT